LERCSIGIRARIGIRSVKIHIIIGIIRAKMCHKCEGLWAR
jgi:hypothetical protein